MRVRFGVIAWDSGVDDFAAICMPSLLQAGNIPWMVRNGFEVVLTVYTLAHETARIQEMLGPALSGIEAPGGSLSANISTVQFDEPVSNTQQRNAQIKRFAFLTESKLAADEHVPLMFCTADAFYGDGSIRNMAVYCRKPEVVTAGIYLRVQRQPFLELMQQYRQKFGLRPISNAKLVDMGLRTQIDMVTDSDVDKDRNASFRSSVAYRRISDDLYACIQHLPSPFMHWPQASDIEFFDLWGGGRFESLDHQWPAKLIAERRWRLLASTDLFFLAELVPPDAAQKWHTYPLEDGRLYNERFVYEMPQTLLHEMVVVTMRREPFLT